MTAPALSLKPAISAVLLGAGLLAAGSAQASELTDHRGYERCISAFDSQGLSKGLSGVTFPRVYYISHRANTKTYYVNARAWENGARVGKRLTCETSNTGREILSVSANSGRFALAPAKALRVAER